MLCSYEKLFSQNDINSVDTQSDNDIIPSSRATKCGSVEKKSTGISPMNEIKVTSKDFSYSTKFLKKNGYTFNGTTKTWSGSKDVSFLIEEGYAVMVREASPLASDCMSQNVEA